MNFYQFVKKLDEMNTSGEISDNDITRFDFVQNGMSYGANKGKPARVSIELPSWVCDKNLKDLGQWKIQLLAVKKEVYTKIINSEES